MFDYSQATVRPWPEQLPFASRDTELIAANWTLETCALLIRQWHNDKPDVQWQLEARLPLEVVIHQDERQDTSLWHRRNESCPNAEGYLVIDGSPILSALLRHEPHLEIDPTIKWTRHFVIGTSGAVAHVICEDTPVLSRVAE